MANTLHIRVPDDLYAAIEKRAEVEERTKNAVVVRLLRLGVAHQDVKFTIDTNKLTPSFKERYGVTDDTVPREFIEKHGRGK